ncbi:hypothetical protein LTR56_017406 [Elasticomyces elasticus]|nr:hypothetical protein LTR56_017406 [Elasticomyces elasticus]KAK3647943.1 hypothetical protein LTR22_013556 [Elasticomyces elasticus]KAK4922434.1 hypothetical protein LTR49_010299 [Elasticomyces elasticus]KAK5765316.1 hypothetical protein LTS12_004573 [Elasticomyces elasticus]
MGLYNQSPVHAKDKDKALPAAPTPDTQSVNMQATSPKNMGLSKPTIDRTAQTVVEVSSARTAAPVKRKPVAKPMSTDSETTTTTQNPAKPSASDMTNKRPISITTRGVNVSSTAGPKDTSKPAPSLENVPEVRSGTADILSSILTSANGSKCKHFPKLKPADTSSIPHRLAFLSTKGDTITHLKLDALCQPCYRLVVPSGFNVWLTGFTGLKRGKLYPAMTDATATKNVVRDPMHSSVLGDELAAFRWISKQNKPFFVDQCHLGFPFKPDALDAETEARRVSDIIVGLLVESVAHVVTGIEECLLDGRAIIQQAGSNVAPGVVIHPDGKTVPKISQLVQTIPSPLIAHSEPKTSKEKAAKSKQQPSRGLGTVEHNAATEAALRPSFPAKSPGPSTGLSPSGAISATKDRGAKKTALSTTVPSLPGSGTSKAGIQQKQTSETGKMKVATMPDTAPGTKVDSSKFGLKGTTEKPRRKKSALPPTGVPGTINIPGDPENANVAGTVAATSTVAVQVTHIDIHGSAVAPDARSGSRRPDKAPAKRDSRQATISASSASSVVKGKRPTKKEVVDDISCLGPCTTAPAATRPKKIGGGPLGLPPPQQLPSQAIKPLTVTLPSVGPTYEPLHVWHPPSSAPVSIVVQQPERPRDFVQAPPQQTQYPSSYVDLIDSREHRTKKQPKVEVNFGPTTVMAPPRREGDIIINTGSIFSDRPGVRIPAVAPGPGKRGDNRTKGGSCIPLKGGGPRGGAPAAPQGTIPRAPGPRGPKPGTRKQDDWQGCILTPPLKPKRPRQPPRAGLGGRPGGKKPTGSLGPRPHGPREPAHGSGGSRPHRGKWPGPGRPLQPRTITDPGHRGRTDRTFDFDQGYEGGYSYESVQGWSPDVAPGGSVLVEEITYTESVVETQSWSEWTSRSPSPATSPLVEPFDSSGEQPPSPGVPTFQDGPSRDSRWEEDYDNASPQQVDKEGNPLPVYIHGDDRFPDHEHGSLLEHNEDVRSAEQHRQEERGFGTIAGWTEEETSSYVYQGTSTQPSTNSPPVFSAPDSNALPYYHNDGRDDNRSAQSIHIAETGADAGPGHHPFDAQQPSDDYGMRDTGERSSLPLSGDATLHECNQSDDTAGKMKKVAFGTAGAAVGLAAAGAAYSTMDDDDDAAYSVTGDDDPDVLQHEDRLSGDEEGMGDDEWRSESGSNGSARVASDADEEADDDGPVDYDSDHDGTEHEGLTDEATSDIDENSDAGAGMEEEEGPEQTETEDEHQFGSEDGEQADDYAEFSEAEGRSDQEEHRIEADEEDFETEEEIAEEQSEEERSEPGDDDDAELSMEEELSGGEQSEAEVQDESEVDEEEAAEEQSDEEVDQESEVEDFSDEAASEQASDEASNEASEEEVSEDAASDDEVEDALEQESEPQMSEPDDEEQEEGDAEEW